MSIKDLTDEDRIIARLYIASERQGWEEGESLAQAQEAARDYWHNKFGDGEAAIDKMRAALSTVSRPTNGEGRP